MKKILILIIILFCFGCRAKYELKINEDLSIEHFITGLEDSEFYNKFTSSKLDVIKLTIAHFNDYLYYNNYEFDEVNQDNLSGGKVYKKFKNLDEFSDEFKLYKMYFNNLDIKIEDGIITINLSDKIIDDEFSDRYIVDEGEIVINVPFDVIENNADKVDGNKYIWNFDLTDNTKNNIYIKFNTNVLSKDKKISIIVIIAVALIVLFGSIFIYRRYKRLKAVKDEI